MLAAIKFSLIIKAEVKKAVVVERRKKFPLKKRKIMKKIIMKK
jgi:hypothetical protein